MDLLKTILSWFIVSPNVKPTPKPEPIPPKPLPPEPTPEPKPTPVQTFRDVLLRLHNNQRAQPLAQNDALNNAAQKHANWMASTGRMSHTGSGGSSVADRAKQAGYSWSYVGENVAYGQKDEQSVMTSWVSSKGHRANIKSSSYDDVGFGMAERNGVKYWAAVFGRSN